jgi:AcrR family transcriptional regulator
MIENDQSNPKIQQIVKTAYDLFMKFGIKRVSVEEICASANVSKMTFYKYFTNKIELTKFIFHKMTSEAESQYRSIMNQVIPYQEKIEQFIHWKQTEAAKYSKEFLGELIHNPDPEIREFFNEKIKTQLQILARDFTQAQENGWIRKDIKPQFLIYMINKMLEMTDDPQLLKMYGSTHDLTAEMLNLFYYGIMPK